jgi:hypothetical protein
MTARRKKLCNCIAHVNKRLADYNGILEVNLLSNPPRAMISVCKVSTRDRRKPPLMEASHCPFCGVKYISARKELATKATKDIKR